MRDDCPDDNALVELAEGLLADPAPVEAHVDACARCAEILAGFMRSSASAEPAPDGRLPRGALIGRYVVLELTGAGAMGTVYAAYDPELDRKVALKVLHHHGAPVLSEARALARLAHPNVVTVHDAGESGGRVYLVMELVDGTTLTAWLGGGGARGALPQIFLEVARGLAAAHRAGIVHRDVKPDNILIGGGRARLGDFGLASVGAGAPGGAGTPLYMAPEQLRGEPCDARADVFGMCATLYEAWEGRRPFAGDTASALLAAIRDGAPAAPARMPAALWRVVQRGLAGEPAARSSELGPLIAALERLTRAPRRLTALALAVAGTALVAGGATYLATRPDPAPACAVTAEIDEVWSPAARARLAAAFEPVRPPYGAETFGRTAAILDGHVARWRTTKRATCDQPAGTPERARLDYCLARSRSQLAALVAMLAAPTPAAIDRAPISASKLVDAETCLAETPSRFPVDDGPRTRELADGLARVLVLDEAGRDPELKALIAELGRGSGDAPDYLRAQLAYWTAVMHRRGNAFADAERALYQALELASRAGDDYDVFMVWALLLTNLAEQGKAEAARAWLPFGRAALARAGDAPRLAIRWHQVAGVVLIQVGAWPDAETSLRAALDAATKLPHTDVLEANIRVNLGNVLAQQGKLDDARPHHERAVALFRAALGPRHPLTGRALQSLGTLDAVAGHSAAARAHLGDALAILEAAHGDSPNVATILDNLGELARGERDFTAALPLAERALAIRERVRGRDHEDVAISLYNLGLTYRELGRRDDARAAWTRAIATYRTALPADHPERKRIAELEAELSKL